MRETFDFYLNGERVRADGGAGGLMLSEFLRKRRALPGTKVVCAEGDCGSCSVLVGRVQGGRLAYRSVASCILQVCQLDAAHVVTVEGLTPTEGLNVLQEAMVACHGSQCGFCTPGIVVAMQELMESGEALTGEAVRRGLSGNLCRCTGYDAIMRAALSVEPGGLSTVGALYPSGAMLEALSGWAGEATRVSWSSEGSGASGTWFKPVTVEEATGFLAERAEAGEPVTVLGGGTDLGVLRNKGRSSPTTLMYTGGIEALGGLERDGNALVLGAATPLVVFEEAMREALPELAEFLGWFGSPPIRHAGTLAGNLCTASPIGDTAPALLVLGAEVSVASASGTRTVGLSEFVTGYRTTALRADELVTSVRVPMLEAGERLRLYKVSRRKDLDISTVSGAFKFRLVEGVVASMSVALGGVAGTVVRLPEVEAYLAGGAASLERFEEAGRMASEGLSPMSDVRGSAAYRRVLCRRLFLKLWHEIDAGRFASSAEGGG